MGNSLWCRHEIINPQTCCKSQITLKILTLKKISKLTNLLLKKSSLYYVSNQAYANEIILSFKSCKLFCNVF